MWIFSYVAQQTIRPERESEIKYEWKYPKQKSFSFIQKARRVQMLGKFGMIRFALWKESCDYCVEDGLEVVRLEARSLLWKYRCEMMRMEAVGVEQKSDD